MVHGLSVREMAAGRFGKKVDEGWYPEEVAGQMADARFERFYE